MTSSPTAPTPARLHTTLAGAPLLLVRRNADGWVATVGGEPRPIRVTVERRTASESGRSTPIETIRRDGARVDVPELWRCLALGAMPVVAPDSVVLKATEAGGHFRQNTFLTVEITLAADGAVELAIDVAEQDESYY